MDEVKTNIQKIGGIVDIYNRAGTTGSTVKIKIPLTLAIIPGLIIKAQKHDAEAGLPTGYEHRFVIPQANLLELVRLERLEDRAQIEYVNGVPVYRRRGQLLPLAYLNRVLGLDAAVFPASDTIHIVVLQAEDRPFGLVVDGIFDTQEIVVKPLGKRLKGLSSYLGATIMGDGRVALILDVQGLARLAGILSQATDVKKSDALSAETSRDIQQTFLIFKAGMFERLAVPLALVSRLEQFPRTSIQFASAKPVLHYREQILPLLTLSELLDTGMPAKAAESETIQVIVFDEGSRRVGVVVDQIVDVIEEAVTFTQGSNRRGLLGSAVIGGTITDLIDLHSLLQAVDAGGSASTKLDSSEPGRILLLDETPIARTMLRGYLEMCGYQVAAVASVVEAMEHLRASPSVDLVITAINLDPKSAWSCWPRCELVTNSPCCRFSLVREKITPLRMMRKRVFPSAPLSACMTGLNSPESRASCLSTSARRHRCREWPCRSETKHTRTEATPASSQRSMWAICSLASRPLRCRRSSGTRR